MGNYRRAALAQGWRLPRLAVLAIAAPLLLLGCARATGTSLAPPADRGVDAVKQDVKACEREAEPGAGTYAGALGVGMLVRVGAVPAGTAAGAAAAPPEPARTPQGGPPPKGAEAVNWGAVTGAALGTLAGVFFGPVVAMSTASDLVNEARQERFERCLLGRGYARIDPGEKDSKSARSRQKTVGVLHLGPVDGPLRDTIAGTLAGPDRVISIGAAEDEAGLGGVAAELMRQRPDVLIADGPAAVAAIRQVRGSTPLVAVVPEYDAVELELARENGRFKGNLTAIAAPGPVAEARCLEALKLALPALSRVAIMRGLDGGAGALWRPELKRTLDRLGLEGLWIVVPPDNGEEAFELARERQPQALLVLAGAADARARRRLAALSAVHRLPAAMSVEDFVDVGGFISCAATRVDIWRQAAEMVSSILDGQRADELRIREPASWTVAVNRSAAQALKLDLQPELLMRVHRIVTESTGPQR